MAHNLNAVDEVWKFLDETPYIRMSMGKYLINTRALAKYIIKEKKLDTTVDAAISAIRRYDLESTTSILEKAHKVISKRIGLSTRSPLANISLIKDDEIQKLLPKLFLLIQYNQGDVLRIIHADESIKVLVDEKNLGKVKKIFPENKIIRIDENLAEINIHQHPDARATPGIIAVISNELAMHNINIMENMSCFPEWLWFVEEKDLLKTYRILNGIL